MPLISIKDVLTTRDASGRYRVTILGINYVQAEEVIGGNSNHAIRRTVPLERDGQPLYALPGHGNAPLPEILRRVNA